MSRKQPKAGADSDVSRFMPAVEAANWRVYRNVKDRLGDLVVALAAEGHRRLPPEDQLSVRLGVSRPTVRSALQALEKEGKVQRLHGRGTFINGHTLGIRANLADDRSFIGILEDLGYAGTVRTLRLYGAKLPADLAPRLDLPRPEQTCVVERVYDASGDPAIVAVDYVPQRLLVAPPAELTGEQSTFEFLHRHTGRRTRYSVAEVAPVVPSKVIAAALQVPRTQPVLLLDHTHIDEDDRPIGVTKAYVNDRFLRFSVIRTYSDT